MSGLRGISRLPRTQDPRARRNAAALASDVSFVGGGNVIVVDGAGFLSVTLGAGLENAAAALAIDLATDPGLEFSSGDLQVKIKASSGVVRDADGLSVAVGDGLEFATGALAIDLATDPGLEFSSGDLQVKIKAAGGVVRDVDGLSVAVTALAPATTSTLGVVLEAVARVDSAQNTVTLTTPVDPTDTPATADDLRDDLVANVLPTYASRDTDLETALETLAGEFNDLLSKLRTAGLHDT